MLTKAFLLETLQHTAQMYVRSSEVYLTTLRTTLEAYHSEYNTLPWKTLKEGSCYLGNVYYLVKAYQDSVLGLIDDPNIKSINDILIELEFNPEHITFGYTKEAYNGNSKCFVSKGQDKKYYKLLHSELKKDVKSFIEIVELKIGIPVNMFLESVEKRLQTALSETLLNAIKSDNLLIVENCINKGVNVNFYYTDGKTPLHYAVDNGNIDIVNTLLNNGAKVVQNTKNDNMLLHLASSKGFRDIIEILLQYVSRDELDDFINAKTANGTTSLHIAAENAYLEVVKSLLKHGANYKIENKDGNLPIEFSKDEKITDLLKLIEELFEDVKNGNDASISKLGALKPDEILVVTHAHNNQGHTLFQVAIINNYKSIADNLLKLLRDLGESQINFSHNSELSQLKKLTRLENAAELHLKFSELYLQMLRNISEPCGSEQNVSRWKTLKEGSYYLGNAYGLVQDYKGYVSSLIDDLTMQSVNDTLVALEFDPKHISSGYTDEAYGGQAICFVSKGQGTKYYKLLHSESKKDVRSFIELVEFAIDIPIKSFLKSIKQRLLCVRLLESIENNDVLMLETYIKQGADINFKDKDGRVSLHYAVNNGNSNIVCTLLKNGAEMSEITNQGNTALHIASSKGYRNIIHILLQHISRDKLNEIINTRRISDGNTSLHLATRNGFLDVVKSLLKYGAIYKIENKEGKIPFDFSKDQELTNLFGLIEEVFADIRNGNVEVTNKLMTLKSDEFLAITNARNSEGNTLLQAAITNKHENISENLLEILKKSHLLQLESLKRAAEVHLKFSKIYLPKLRSMSEKNEIPWLTLKEGSYYLGNAYKLVKRYQDSIPCLIDDPNMKSVNDVLVKLEFDPKHITSGYTNEAYGGETICFVSKGQGTTYYNLLHSKLMNDVKSFVKMAELNIDIPVKKFLESIKKRLCSSL